MSQNFSQVWSSVRTHFLIKLFWNNKAMMLNMSRVALNFELSIFLCLAPERFQLFKIKILKRPPNGLICKVFGNFYNFLLLFSIIKDYHFPERDTASVL